MDRIDFTTISILLFVAMIAGLIWQEHRKSKRRRADPGGDSGPATHGDSGTGSKAHSSPDSDSGSGVDGGSSGGGDGGGGGGGD